MKILVVMANYPLPLRTGSAIVAYNSIKLLSTGHELELICPQAATVDDEFRGTFGRVDFVERKKASWLNKWMRYLFGMLRGVPPEVSIFASSTMIKKVQERIKEGEFDVILLFEMIAIQYCPSSCFYKLAVNIEDPQSIKLFRMKKLPIWSFWRWVKLSTQALITLFYEYRILPEIGKVFLLSEEDARDMRKQGGYENIAHVPYGIEQSISAEIKSYENRERAIVFSGNMFHSPNVDGALFFLADVFPLILRRYPSAVLWIVGADPDNRIYAAAKEFGKQVLITGKVNDVAEYIKCATVSICPVRLKIGVQTKILEALSWGTPVVTTSAGNSGIGGVAGTHLWVEDDAPMLAQRVCELLRGHNWEKLSTQGKKLVMEVFSWENSAAQLEHHLEALIAKN